jgi:hypothetical protein
VLIDASSPQQIDELPGFRASYEQDKREAERDLWVDRLRVWSGWERLVGHCSADHSSGLSGQAAAMACRPEYVDTDESELTYFEASCREAGRLISLGRIPLLIISRDPTIKNPGMTGRQMEQQSVWAREQESSKSLSPLSWRVVAQGSGHMVPLDRPDVIVQETTRLVEYLRGGPFPAFGATTIE